MTSEMAPVQDGNYEGLLEKAKDVPITALNYSCRKKLGLYLDPEGDLIPGKDICNDWCGLAEKAGFNSLEITHIKSKRDSTMEFLHSWSAKPFPKPTVENLIKFLLELERLDVLTDCHRMIDKDIDKYKTRATVEANSPVVPVHPRPEENIYYDAFVIYNPDANDQLNFVKEFAHKMEGPEFNLRLFIPWRDDLPGDAQYSVTAETIERKCRRSVVILSRSFYNSPAADFQLKFVQSLSPGARSKRVIPVMIEECPVPNILNFVGPANFYNPGLRDWQWTRVSATITAQLNPEIETWAGPDAGQHEIELDTSNQHHRRFWSLFVATVPLPDGQQEQQAQVK